MFFGREDQMEQLEALWGKRVSSLVTCRGRRRVGKSTLVEEFARRSGAKFIKIEGVRPGSKATVADELRAFARQLARQTKAGKEPPEDWYSAFGVLDGQISDKERTVVLLDEVSWLAYGDDTFADYLKIAWDNGLKKHDRLILVVCGSVSTWIRDNIICNRAYVGRRSLDMVVPELPLRECVKFWGKAAARTDVREIIDVLSVTGGIPRYLEEINPSLSAEENIRRLAFRPKGVLREDFDEMFNDVITSRPKFTASVLRSLTDGPKCCIEVAKCLGIGKGGDVSDAMAVLEESGFVSPECTRNPETGKEVRERRYRLRDNYARFYLKYIEPRKAMIRRGSYRFVSLSSLPDWNTVMGLQFENLIVNNAMEVVRFLGIGNSTVESAAPYRRKGSKGKNGRKGCQIDLLIQTRRALCFVEVSPVAAADGYFDAIIPFQRLLGL